MSRMANADDANETIASLLARNRRAGRILLNHGMQCVGCVIAPFETLAEVCVVYDVPLDRILEELRVESGGESQELSEIAIREADNGTSDEPSGPRSGTATRS